MSLFSPSQDTSILSNKSCAKSFFNSQGLILSPYAGFPYALPAGTSQIAVVGVGLAVVGSVQLEGGQGSKVMDSDSYMYFTTGQTFTFSDPTSVLRVGVQDIDASGVPDGVYDVYGDFIGGVDTLVPITTYRIKMSTGTRVINHGDVLAFNISLVSGTDTINLLRRNPVGALSSVYPYPVFNGVKSASQIPYLGVIEFSDGTVGYMKDIIPHMAGSTTPLFFNFNVDSSPDEYAMVFSLPISTTISAIFGHIFMPGDVEIILYSDPLGTPKIEQVMTQSSNEIATTGGWTYHRPFAPELKIKRNKQYAISFRPTTGAANALAYLDYGTGNEALKRATPLGENWSLGYRTDQSGSFVLDESKLPAMALYINKLCVCK